MCHLSQFASIRVLHCQDYEEDVRKHHHLLLTVNTTRFTNKYLVIFVPAAVSRPYDDLLGMYGIRTKVYS